MKKKKPTNKTNFGGNEIDLNETGFVGLFSESIWSAAVLIRAAPPSVSTLSV